MGPYGNPNKWILKSFRVIKYNIKPQYSPTKKPGGKPNLYWRVYLIEFRIYPRMRHFKKGLNDVLNQTTQHEMI